MRRHPNLSVIRIFLLLVLALAPVSAARARSLSTLRGDARLLAKDNVSSRARFTDAQITAWLNEAQQVATLKTYCIQTSIQFPLVAGTTYYSLPATIIDIIRVTRDNMALPELTPAALDGRSQGWEASSGLPTYYFVNFSSASKIGFAPWPAVSTDTGTIKMEFRSMPSDMSADSDSPFDNSAASLAVPYMLTYYAAARMAAVDGRTDIATLYLALFEDNLKAWGARCQQRPSYLPGQSSRP